MFQNEKIPVLGSLDEKVVETRTCKHCFSSFDITNKDLKMYEKNTLSPFLHFVRIAENKEGLLLEMKDISTKENVAQQKMI